MKSTRFICILLCWTSLSFGQNVGIGTPTPDYTLDVNGSLGINDFVHHNDDNDTWMGFPAPDTWELNVGGKRAAQVDAINSALTVNPDSDDIEFIIRGDGINTLLRADTQNDHIGIGNSDPQHLVDIDNGNMLIHGDGINTLIYADHDNSRVGIGTATPEHLIDVDNGNMRIHGDGINTLLFVDHFNDKVGIGTDNPQEELHVIGTIKADTIDAAHIPLPNMKYGQITVTAGPNGTTLFTPQINYSGFTNPPHLFVTMYDVDNQGDEGAVSYSYSVYNVTNTSAKIRLEEPDFGPMFGDIIIYWMAIE